MKYEYKTEIISVRGIEQGTAEDAFNKLGQKGWKMVSHTSGPVHHLFFFMRPLTGEQAT